MVFVAWVINKQYDSIVDKDTDKPKEDNSSNWNSEKGKPRECSPKTITFIDGFPCKKFGHSSTDHSNDKRTKGKKPDSQEEQRKEEEFLFSTKNKGFFFLHFNQFSESMLLAL